MDTEKTIVVIDGIAFENWKDDLYEHYMHTDSDGKEWGLFRHRESFRKAKAPWVITNIWFATVSRTLPDVTIRTLNLCEHDREGGIRGKDPLFDIDAYNHIELLKGLVDFMKHSKEDPFLFGFPSPSKPANENEKK